jgi:hypothetical protein
MTDIRIIVPTAVRQSSALGFPRLCAYVISDWPTGNQSLDDIDRYSNANWCVFQFLKANDPTGTLPGNGLTRQEVLDRVRANNPGILIQEYGLAHTWRRNNDPDTLTGYNLDVYNEISAEEGPGTSPTTDWYAYKTDGVTTDGDFGKQKFLNWSSFVTADINGDKVAGWNAQRHLDDAYSAADFDGFFNDANKSVIPNSSDDMDFDQDGDTDESATIEGQPDGGTGTGDVLFKTFLADFWSKFQTIAADGGNAMKVRTGNIGTWTFSSRKFGDPQPEMALLLHGGMHEGMMGKAFSDDNFFPWDTHVSKTWFDFCNMNVLNPGTFATLPSNAPAQAQAPLTIFDCEGAADDFQKLRYQLCTCLLSGDGYFEFQTGSTYGALEFGTWRLYDEYHRGVDDVFNWMEQPTDSPIDADAEAAWSNGVYAREFDNGAIFVNPKGNGNQTIDPRDFPTAGTGLWKRIDGTQDPTVNDGTNITGSFTLNVEDGLVVVRQ